MIVEILAVGKTSDAYIETGIELYLSRLKHYGRYSITTIAEGKNNKNLTTDQIKNAQGETILTNIKDGDFVVLLDENGAQYSSENFAAWWQSILNRGTRRVLFIIGGAYGFSDAIYARADAKLGLSKMTFSHQMVRLFFVEQLYRAHTILKGEPYHHS